MKIFLVLIGMLSVLLPQDSRAVVWRGDVEEVQQEAKDEMRQVGEVFFSPFQVFGASCVALGGKWVLTCRHGTEDWVGSGMKVGFPHLGKKRYEVKRAIFPKEGDFALLELKKKVRKAKPLRLQMEKVKKDQRVWLGGYGMAGPVGKVTRSGDFHAGHNRVDQVKSKIAISLGKPEDKKTEKQEAILAAFDSGSPLFVEVDNGWVLAGIGSAASHRLNPKYGSRAYYARVSEVSEWINKQISK